VIRAARDIVNRSIKQLDSEKVQAVIGGAQSAPERSEDDAYPDVDAAKTYGVKESPAEYVH
jgi:hypothetical protein